MTCDEDPLRRRPGNSTVRLKRWERCVWMTGIMRKWPSGYGQPTKIRLPDGCKRDAVHLAVDQWYDFHEFGCHLGNVGSLNSNVLTKHLKRGIRSGLVCLAGHELVRGEYRYVAYFCVRVRASGGGECGWRRFHEILSRGFFHPADTHRYGRCPFSLFAGEEIQRTNPFQTRRGSGPTRSQGWRAL